MLLAPYRPIIKPKYECQIFHPKEAHQHNPEDTLDSDDSSVISHCDSDLSWDYYDIHSEDEIGEWGGHIYGGMEDTPSQVPLYDDGMMETTIDEDLIDDLFALNCNNGNDTLKVDLSGSTCKSWNLNSPIEQNYDDDADIDAIELGEAFDASLPSHCLEPRYDFDSNNVVNCDDTTYNFDAEASHAMDPENSFHMD